MDYLDNKSYFNRKEEAYFIQEKYRLFLLKGNFYQAAAQNLTFFSYYFTMQLPTLFCHTHY